MIAAGPDPILLAKITRGFVSKQQEVDSSLVT